MPGFGSGPFGLKDFGEWLWSQRVLYESMPNVYREQDAESGNGRLRALLEALAPLLDVTRRQIRDLGDLRDPLRAPTNYTFNETVRIIRVDDLGDGTSRVFLSIGTDGTKFDGIRPGYVLIDYSGAEFDIESVCKSARPEDFTSPPIDPATGNPTGRHLIVRNISIGTSPALPLVSGTAYNGEDPVTSPVDNGTNVGPYTFTLAHLPAKNRVIVSWTVGSIAYSGFFTNTGLMGGSLAIGSTIIFDTGVLKVATGIVPVDSGSIRVSYTGTVVPSDDPTCIRSQNLLGFLGQDYGADVDRHDSEALQRSLVYHAYQLWDEKGASNGYRDMGRISGYNVRALQLYKVGSTPRGLLPTSRIYEIPATSGNWYTDILPRRARFDEVAADAVPSDLFTFESSYPSTTQAVEVSAVTSLGMDGSSGRYRVVADTTAYSSAYKTFDTEGTILDVGGHSYEVGPVTRLAATTFSFEVVGLWAPALGAATITWKVLKATSSDPDLTLVGGEIAEIGLQSVGATGVRYALTYDFGVAIPVVSDKNWLFIDSAGVRSAVESVQVLSGTTYRIEFISATAPAAGPANLFYKCAPLFEPAFAGASVLRFIISPSEATAPPLLLTEDVVERLLGRLSQMVPAHVRFADFVYDPGPVVASWGGMVATASTTATSSNVLEEYLVGDSDPIASEEWTATGLWRVTSLGSDFPRRAFAYNHGDPPNYDTGGANSGTLTSPVVNVDSGTVVVRFSHYADLEAGAVDLPIVQIRSYEGTILYAYDKGALGLIATGNTGGTWVSVTIDITEFVVGSGDFQLEFAFEADSVNNTTRGWYIDDVEIKVEV